MKEQVLEFINKIMHNNFNLDENDKIIKYSNKQFIVLLTKQKKYNNGIVIDNRGNKPIIYNDIKIAIKLLKDSYL